AFRLVEKGAFRRLLQYQRPQTKDTEIPHRTFVREEIMQKASDVEAQLREVFKDIPGQISVTFDAWTSKAYDPYLSVTAHYIAHSSQYPVLSRIARDYLAIQGSAVASERAFSSGGRTGTALRNHLASATFEALQILKSGYWDGIVSAVEAVAQAAKESSDTN
ncbi:hypothetical protein PHLCEN_2v854, partial [Hermanssonia centrifuga]